MGSSNSSSEGLSEALMPVLEIMHTAVEGETEVMHRAILQLRRLPPRTYLYVRPDTKPTIIVVPSVDDPKVLKSHVPKFIEAANERSTFVRPADEEDVVIVEDEEADDDAQFRYRPRD